MTAILALTNGKTVWLGGDSFCGDDDKKDLCKSPKVYKIGTKLGVGLCGMVRQELIIEKTLRKAIEIDKIKLTHNWIKFELPDLLCNEIKEKGASIKEKEQETLGQSMYLLAFDGKIYYLECDFGIWESQRNIAGIGTGKKYALGALSALNDVNDMPPEDKIIKSLSIAAEWNMYVCSPFNVISV